MKGVAFVFAATAVMAISNHVTVAFVPTPRLSVLLAKNRIDNSASTVEFASSASQSSSVSATNSEVAIFGRG